jgi:phosphocarrier protein HPr
MMMDVTLMVDWPGKARKETSTVPNETVSRTVAVTNPTGLCMRGASAICQLADLFQCKISLIKEGQSVSTTDALEIVLLAAECGSEIVVEATGGDAEEAVEAMAALFANDFGLPH